VKTQIYLGTRQSAQHAIDEIKKAYATGMPHVMIIREPVPQQTRRQQKKVWVMVSVIATETGEQDEERMTDIMLNDMGWFAALGEELAPTRVSLTRLSKKETSFFIDRLDQFMSEQGYIH